MTPWEQVKKFQATIAVVVALLGSFAYLEGWWTDRVVSKQQWIEGNVNHKLYVVEMKILMFQLHGLEKLDDGKKHEYDQLVIQQTNLSCQRDLYLGDREQC